MHVRTRSRSFVPAGGVLYRSRCRPGSHAQSHASPLTVAASPTRQRPPGGALSARRASKRHTALLSRTPVRSGGADRQDQPRSGVNLFLIKSVRWYQRSFAGRPSPCRFFPTCSCYALEALEVHGSAHGLWLTTRRLVRCRPFGPSGFDPVPEISPLKEK